MERKDFKKITKRNLEICKKIIKNDGDCMDLEIDCEECLLNNENTTLDCGGSAEQTLALCKEAIEKFDKRKRHHQITRNEMKKFYTYLRKKYCVVGDKTNDLNSYGELDKAISKIIDDIVRKALREQKEKILLRVNDI